MLAQLDFDSINTDAGIKTRNGILAGFASDTVPYIFFAIGAVLLLLIISSGFQIMLATGDPKKIEGGKKSLSNALVGFGIVFGAYWIVKLLGLILGINNDLWPF